MLDFKLERDINTNELYIKTSLKGKPLLTTPQLNKGTAFTYEEREAFGLLGKLPYKVETIEEQMQRAYLQFTSYTNRLQQNIYLNNLHDKNQILFYKLVSHHLAEMLPIIYTPIVGAAVKRFSHEYRQPRGLYIAHTDQQQIESIINNRSNPDIDLIVVTDGEGVLGIGDQGIGGMDIPVAKLMVYSLCGGIDPSRTLPVFLDVGTNNQALLDDPLYLGCKHKRIPKPDYDKFIATFVSAVQKHFPNVFLHWEDLGRDNANRVLSEFQDSLCTFNDDIQGTGVVTLAALLAACDVLGESLEDQRILVFGAGSAGIGICDQIIEYMLAQGLTHKEAVERFWLVDRQGLLLQLDANLTEAQKNYARSPAETQSWPMQEGSYLEHAVRQIKPTILIGCSAQTGAFTQSIVETMSANCARPIIFPLSNPDEQCEAQPADILAWSQGLALIATGTAFPPVTFDDRVVKVAQCNNALVFPGIGLGLLAVAAKRLTKEMLLAASDQLRAFAPSKQQANLPLLPSLDDARQVAKAIAVSVAAMAIENGLAQKNQDKDLDVLIEGMFWEPSYLPFRHVAPII